MKKLINLFLFCLLSAGLFQFANAEGKSIKTNEDLLECLEADKRTTEQNANGADYARSNFGLGFIVGVVQENQLSENLICVPDGVSNEQGARIVRKYLNDNPEKGHHPAAEGVVTALSKAFPCHK